MTITTTVLRSTEALEALCRDARERIDPTLIDANTRAEERFDREVWLDVWDEWDYVGHMTGVIDAATWAHTGGPGPLGGFERFSDELNFARRIQEGSELIPEGRSFDYCQGYVRALRWAADDGSGEVVDPLFYGG